MFIRTEITGIGDPFILNENGTYYAYATTSPDGFRVFCSDDLFHWSEGEYCYRDSKWGENCFWAPEVYRYRGKVYMLYTARWKENHSLRLGLAVADSPMGPFKDIVDGPLFDEGYAAIDGTLFFDDDGRIYLYFARDCSENIIDGIHKSEIYFAELDKDLHLSTKPVRVTTPDLDWETSLDPEWQWNEGPAMLKHNGKYYLNYSVNCYNSAEYSVGCAVADSPAGPFVKYEKPVLAKREGDFSGPGHNNFFVDKDGRLMTSFHIHTDPARPSGNRRICFAEAGFDDKGEFRIIL